MQVTLSGEQQTHTLGRWLAGQLAGGQVVSLEGPLGAGKTTLLQGIAEGLGIKTQQTSPTFILFRSHTLPKPAGHARSVRYLVHADAYRIKNPQELIVTGFPEFVGQRETVTVVEWGDRVPSLLPAGTLHLKLTRPAGSKGSRSVSLPALIGRPPKSLFSQPGRSDGKS